MGQVSKERRHGAEGGLGHRDVVGRLDDVGDGRDVARQPDEWVVDRGVGCRPVDEAVRWSVQWCRADDTDVRMGEREDEQSDPWSVRDG